MREFESKIEKINNDGDVIKNNDDVTKSQDRLSSESDEEDESENSELEIIDDETDEGNESLGRFRRDVKYPPNSRFVSFFFITPSLPLLPFNKNYYYYFHS